MRKTAAPDVGRQAVAAFQARFGRDYPSATQRLLDDLEASRNPWRVAPVHRKYVRTTTLLERTFEEELRRTTVMPRTGTAHRSLKLIWGMLGRASWRWRGWRFSDMEVKRMEQRWWDLGLDTLTDPQTPKTSSDVA